MEKIKNSFIAKAAAYIIILVCVVMVVFSAIMIFLNVERAWYGKDVDGVKSDIYMETASYANNLLSVELYLYNSESWIIPEEIELIPGEEETTEFGYIISSKTTELAFADGKKTVPSRAVNEKLKANEGIYREGFSHFEMDIEIYLGEIRKGSVPDQLYHLYTMQKKIYELRYKAIAAGSAALLLAVCMFLFLITNVGKNTAQGEGSDKKSLLDRCPIEIIIGAACAAASLTIVINASIYYEMDIHFLVMLIFFDAILCTAIAMGVILSVAVKLRHHTFLRNSLIYLAVRVMIRGMKWTGRKWIVAMRNCSAVVKWAGRKCSLLASNIPLIWKTILILFIGLAINFMTLLISWSISYIALFMWFIEALATAAAVIYVALCLRKLREAASNLAAGQLDYQVDQKGLIWDMAKHADDLNSIGQGMSKAVEERIKSERFKAELITNVSHDIKTPLTSIINYVDFLKQEDIENEKAREYIDVLDRQSQRLKKLTEDLVEASKAMTGNVKLNRQPCKIGVLMMQVMGEYEERTKKEDLKLISRISDEELEIFADSRSMWRIFDNLYSNICKYSQPGTRVYQTLQRREEKAIVTYKNTSRFELDITGEELMERFVRGDSSRHTEGSGLGLSIAKNLAELQNGSFKIFIDGDLFKVIMEFPLMIRY